MKKDTKQDKQKRKSSAAKQQKSAGITKNNRNKPLRTSGAVKPKKPANRSRTASGKVPQGRTLTTRDKYLDKEAKQPEKERPVVVIETNARNDLAVVQLTSTEGKDRTRLKKYQQGQSLFKHYVEIEDDEGNPIQINQKFKENHPNMDVSREDVEFVKDIVFNHSTPMQKNRKSVDKFRSKKK